MTDNDDREIIGMMAASIYAAYTIKHTPHAESGMAWDAPAPERMEFAVLQAVDLLSEVDRQLSDK